MTLQKLMRALLVVGAWLSLPLVALAQEVVPDFYKEPGISPNRAYLNQHYSEHIDPFTGALQQHYTDIHVPGPAGFDLNLTRSYSSFTTFNPAAEPALPAGLGWSMHFGRVLMRGSTNPCLNRLITTWDNPVLELPDGSKHVFYFSGVVTPIWISAQRWSATCFGAGMGLVVNSPDGVRYEMSQAVTEVLGATAANSNYVWYARSITDRNGNRITISYAAAQSPRISSIATSDGRSLTFGYSGCADGQHVCSVSGPTSTWNYQYQLVPNTTNRYFLTRATRPDGTAWQYEYNGNIGPAAGSFLMRRMVYPQGGAINYGYMFVNFLNPGNPAGGSAVVSSKSTSDSGNWSFSYVPGSFGVNDRTTVTTPAGTITYQHVGANTVGSGNVWRIGLLMEKISGSVETETLTWTPSAAISSESNSRPGDFSGKVDAQIYIPQLSSRSINRNGTTFSTTYSDFDTYGNPRRIVEAGPMQGNRTTTLSYYINPTLWIVRQVDDEITEGVGSIAREWDGLGRMLSETRDGVRTSFTYHGTGDRQSITNPRNFTSNYNNYFRGTAQNESHPEGVSINRVVDSAGNVTSETNGEGRTTAFRYDALNRLTFIQPPRGNTTNITYSGATRKTATRGSLSEITNFDAFSRLQNKSVGGISTSYRHDALGRMTFQSYPGSANGTTYGYDLLNRVTSVVHPDGSSRGHAYTGASVTVRNERNFSTTYGHRAYGDPDKQLLMTISAPVPSANVAIQRNGRGLVQTIAQDGVTRSYGYDTRYYLTSVVNPETGMTVLGRDAAGNMTSRRVGSSSSTVYGYDGLDRLTSVSYPSASTPSVSRTYTRTGKARSVTTAVASRVFDYDANDNLTSESLTVDGIALVAVYAYNANDQMTAITYPRSNLVVQLSPDVLGRPTTVGAFATNVSYWPNGQVHRITFGNGSTSTYGQDSRLRPASAVAQTGVTTHANSAYGYDTANNLRTITDSADSSYSRSFEYDAIDRLTTANGSWGSGSIGYDGAGNIRTISLGSNYLVNHNYANNRLSSTSGTRTINYGYDVYGNVSSAAGAAYQYDHASNLSACVSCISAGTINHRYDGANARVSTTRAGVMTYEFWSANGGLLSELTPSQGDQLIEYFYLAGKRIAQRQSQSGIATSTALTLSPNPATTSQAVALTATVTAANGTTPSGTVEFFENGVSLGVTSLSGTPARASLQRTFPTVGSRSIHAVFSASVGYNGSASAPVSLTITSTSQIATSTALLVSPNPGTVLQPMSLTATVTPSSGTPPTGLVQFLENGAVVASASLSGSPARATVQRTYSTVGTRNLQASFAATGTHAASASAIVSASVNEAGGGTPPPISTATLLTANPAAVFTGGNLLLTATVTNGTLAAIVDFRDGGVNGPSIGTAVLTGTPPTATLSRSFGTAGVKTIFAVYQGSSTTASSASVGVSVSVISPPPPATVQMKRAIAILLSDD
jgi:YD repeat-containing protein